MPKAKIAPTPTWTITTRPVVRGTKWLIILVKDGIEDCVLDVADDAQAAQRVAEALATRISEVVR